MGSTKQHQQGYCCFVMMKRKKMWEIKWNSSGSMHLNLHEKFMRECKIEVLFAQWNEIHAFQVRMLSEKNKHFPWSGQPHLLFKSIMNFFLRYIFIPWSWFEQNKIIITWTHKSLKNACLLALSSFPMSVDNNDKKNLFHHPFFPHLSLSLFLNLFIFMSFHFCSRKCADEITFVFGMCSHDLWISNWNVNGINFFVLWLFFAHSFLFSLCDC